MEPELEKLLADAQAFEQTMRDAQASLQQAIVTGRSSDGTVAVVAGGLGELKAVRVDPGVFEHRDADRLATAIAEAVRAAGDAARRLAEQRMGPIEINLH
ncbi:YbaB/EbfC family nucleoid-associated protein [Actinoplanes sp. CA-054009]